MSRNYPPYLIPLNDSPAVTQVDKWKQSQDGNVASAAVLPAPAFIAHKVTRCEPDGVCAYSSTTTTGEVSMMLAKGGNIIAVANNCPVMTADGKSYSSVSCDDGASLDIYANDRIVINDPVRGSVSVVDNTHSPW